MKNDDLFIVAADRKMEIPLVECSVAAGFASAAEEYIEKKLDLNDLLIKHPAATFFIRVEGDSMVRAGIQSGDLLVVDRAVAPGNGKIVLAMINGEFTVKRMVLKNKKLFLKAENPAYPSFLVQSEDFRVWGVVTYVIHKA